MFENSSFDHTSDVHLHILLKCMILMALKLVLAFRDSLNLVSCLTNLLIIVCMLYFRAYNIYHEVRGKFVLSKAQTFY